MYVGKNFSDATGGDASLGYDCRWPTVVTTCRRHVVGSRHQVGDNGRDVATTRDVQFVDWRSQFVE